MIIPHQPKRMILFELEYKRKTGFGAITKSNMEQNVFLLLLLTTVAFSKEGTLVVLNTVFL